MAPVKTSFTCIIFFLVENGILVVFKNVVVFFKIRISKQLNKLNSLTIKALVKKKNK